MPAIHIVDKYQAIQYTGSNSAEIVSAVGNAQVVSESGGTLELESPVGSGHFFVDSGGWVRFISNQVLSTCTSAEFGLNYIHNAVFADVDLEAVTDRLDLLEAADPLLSSGVGAVPALLLNASTVVTVTLDPAMADDTFAPHARLLGSASLLGNLSITAVSIVDEDTVDVTVQNSGLATGAGATVLVTATA